MKFDDPNFVKQIIRTDFSNHKSLLEDVFEEIDTRTRQERNILLQPFYADQMFYYHPEDPHFKGYLLLPHGGSFNVAFEYYSVEDFGEKFNQAMPASYDDFKEQLREQIGKHDYEDLINRDSHAISNLYKSMVIAKTTMKEFSNTYLQVTETIDKLAGVVNDYLDENGRDDLLFNENDYFNLYQRSKAVNEYLEENPLEPNIDNLKKAFDFLCELNFCTDDLEAYDELLQHDVIPTECIVLTSIYDWVQGDDKYQTNYEAIDDFIDDSSFNFYDQANELVNQVKDLLVQSNENQVTKSRGR